MSISTLALPAAAEAKPPADDVIIYTSDPTEPPPTTAPSTKPTTAATKPTEARSPAATAPTTPPTIPTISEPFEQGNAIASSLQYHKDTNKQFLTIETRSGALCRAKADWLVGIDASRFFSLTYKAKLNIGRVMSPTPA